MFLYWQWRKFWGSLLHSPSKEIIFYKKLSESLVSSSLGFLKKSDDKKAVGYHELSLKIFFKVKAVPGLCWGLYILSSRFYVHGQCIYDIENDDPLTLESLQKMWYSLKDFMGSTQKTNHIMNVKLKKHSYFIKSPHFQPCQKSKYFWDLSHSRAAFSTTSIGL